MNAKSTGSDAPDPKADERQKLEELARFIDAMTERLGLPEELVDGSMNPILGLTGVAAHGVVRPAGPFAAMFAGWLVGAGRAATISEATRMVRDLLEQYMAEHERSEAPGEGSAG